MSKKFKLLWTLLTGLLIGLCGFAVADPVTLFDGFEIAAGKVGMLCDKIQYRSSGSTGKATIKYVDSVANSRTYTYPDAGANANIILSEGAKTINGAITLGTPLTKANVNDSVKKVFLFARLSPETGAAADSTVYKALIPVGRAFTVTAIKFVAETPPAGGTDTLKVLKGSSSGNTMLNAASFDATTLVANTISAGTLTSTGADLAVNTTTPIYAEYSQGSATTDAAQVGCVIEGEMTDL